ncbi:MAG TPA: hypothetical protein VMU10_07635 [Desulfomonilia bacterium]|nr:hypothetical protein [Desulfomonilia bacterium]
MNAGNTARTYEGGLNVSKITTLYDLMEEINAKQLSPNKEHSGYLNTYWVEAQFSPVAEKVARMFESGQIRFKNLQDVKRKYADWFI